MPDNDPEHDGYGRTHGLSGHVIFFSSLFERLIQFDIASAKQEFEAWPKNDETIFSRLRIWACGTRELVSTQDFGLVMVELSDGAFWDSYHQRDLLLVVVKRASICSSNKKRN